VGSGIIAGEITGSAVLGVFWALLADYVVMTLGAPICAASCPSAAQLLMHADLADMCASVVMAAGRQSCLVFRLCSLGSSSLGGRVLRR